MAVRKKKARARRSYPEPGEDRDKDGLVEHHPPPYRTRDVSKRVKLTITMDPHARQILEDVGNVSDYLSKIVEQRWRDWQDAVQLLRAHGWTAFEIVTACELMGGAYQPFEGRQPEMVAADMNGNAYARDIFASGEMSQKRMDELVDMVASKEPVARAVAVLAREFWTGNAAVAKRVSEAT